MRCISAAPPSFVPESDTISDSLNLSVDQPLEGNRTKWNGTSPTFHWYWTRPQRTFQRRVYTAVPSWGSAKSHRTWWVHSHGFPAPWRAAPAVPWGTLDGRVLFMQMAPGSRRKARGVSWAEDSMKSLHLPWTWFSVAQLFIILDPKLLWW